MGLSSYDERFPRTWALNLGSDQGTDWQFLAQGADGGSRIDAMLAGNTDVIDHVLSFAFGDSAERPVGSINVPAGTGTAGTPALEVLAPLAPAQIGGWLLDNTTVLKVRVEVMVGFGASVSLQGWGGQL